MVTEQRSIDIARPVRNLLVGIATPTATMTGFAAAAVLMAMVLGAPGGALSAAAYTGATVGFLVSFYGLVELAIAFAFSGAPFMNRLCRAIGYAAVWAAGVIVILHLRY